MKFEYLNLCNMNFFSHENNNEISIMSIQLLALGGFFFRFFLFYKKVINKKQTHVAFNITFTYGIHHEPNT